MSTVREWSGWRGTAGVVALAVGLGSSPVAAQELPGEATVRGLVRGSEVARGRSASVVSRRELEERVVRSAPDALRYVPGVTVQQTAHGQASPYVRGLTGQQVLLVFDGVRLNNGIYRQGPNQYFFTVDALTLDRIEVLRGSASTRWGADALGGVVVAYPREPRLDPRQGGVSLRPRVVARAASADASLGARGELDLQFGRRVAFLAGGSYRDVSALQAGGPLRDLATGAPAPVPLFEADGRTQRGTGFREATFDARMIAQVAPALRATVALYGYRQFDAPRTDQCPPPLAPERECLVVEEQFRTLAYATLRGDAGPLRDVDVVVSYQRHHERRRRDRPLASAIHGALDDVDTLGLALRGATPRLRLSGPADEALPGAVGLRLRYGADVYRDGVSSAAWLVIPDVGVTVPASRGQYVEGSRYIQTGLFAEAELDALAWLRVRGGLRLAAASARAPADPESGTRAVRGDFAAAVARAGVELLLRRDLAVLANVDQGFRAPNLDDLSARQQAGPGFQFENAALGPERSVSWELGARLATARVELQAWTWAMRLEGALTRAPRSAAECPPDTPECIASRSRFQLVNAPGDAWLLGAEAAARVFLPGGVGVAATLAYAWGEGPTPTDRPALSAQPFAERVPLSRVPPLNGTVELRWRHRAAGITLGAALRWAADQTRLAPADLGDARIPPGGTRGYAVLDLRGQWRLGERLSASAVLENVLDAPYRVHGSSVNGPGRGVLLSLTAGL